MQITPMMIEAAVNKACELGLLPRRTVSEDFATNTEIMLDILQAALNADKHSSPRSNSSSV